MMDDSPFVELEKHRVLRIGTGQHIKFICKNHGAIVRL